MDWITTPCDFVHPYANPPHAITIKSHLSYPHHCFADGVLSPNPLRKSLFCLWCASCESLHPFLSINTMNPLCTIPLSSSPYTSSSSPRNNPLCEHCHSPIFRPVALSYHFFSRNNNGRLLERFDRFHPSNRVSFRFHEKAARWEVDSISNLGWMDRLLGGSDSRSCTNNANCVATFAFGVLVPKCTFRMNQTT